MWLRLSIVGALCALAACGFEPVYGNRAGHVDTVDLLSAIQVQTPGGRQGDQLKADIEDRFNPQSLAISKRYLLEVQLQSASDPFIIESDGTASRFRVTFTSPFTLKRISDNKVLQQGTIKRQASYNVSEDDDYSTFISQNDAIKRAITELAEDYKMRISALFARAQK